MRDNVTFSEVRAPAMAGRFYPADGQVLRGQVEQMLHRAVESAPAMSAFPKAIIVPHAGYQYSGQMAANAHARLLPGRERIRRVLLLGPAHHWGLPGLAASSARSFATPLGTVPIDTSSIATLVERRLVRIADEAHLQEHSLEVQIPFLQCVLRDFTLVPIAIGRAQPEDVAEVLLALWGGAETCFVISSDLSHFHPAEVSRRIDSETSHLIEGGRLDELNGSRACGFCGIQGLMLAAQAHDLCLQNLGLTNSGESGGGEERVVGYGAFMTAPRGRAPKQISIAEEPLSESDRSYLLNVAKKAIRLPLEQGERLRIDMQRVPERLRKHGAAFVTLRSQGDLRGCVGWLNLESPTVESVAESAYRAAFSDSRFPPLTPLEISRLEVHISLLSAVTPVQVSSEAELQRTLQPGVDGLILRSGSRSALFLPSVWKQVPDAGTFIRRLKQKGGWGEEEWPADMRAERFTVEEIVGGF